MNAFQILDRDSNAIAINTLDREICELLGNEYDNKYYAMLGRREDHASEIDFIRRTSNWFDVLGWQIAQGKNFEEIIATMAEDMKEYLGKIDENGKEITLEVIYPYHLKVLNHWINQGYQPKQVKE